jgi:hypothetical protein
MSMRAIAVRLGRSPSTISRELRRNAHPGRCGGYRPFDAHRRAAVRRARIRGLRVDTEPEPATACGAVTALVNGGIIADDIAELILVQPPAPVRRWLRGAAPAQLAAIRAVRTISEH